MLFSGERSHNREIVSKCRSVWGNFDFYFTIGEIKHCYVYVTLKCSRKYAFMIFKINVFRNA